MNTFTNYSLVPALQQVLAQKGIQEPTPVQQQVLPLLGSGRDVLAVAPTGTGKTLAFLLPLLQDLLPLVGKAGIKALILTPSRELAIQISTVIEELTRHSGLRQALLIGGDAMEEQIYLLDRGVDLVVGTPGRVNHLEKEGLANFRRIQWFVIDEGDRMLDMGFIGVIRKIVRGLPRKRRSALFSATLQEDTLKLSKEVLYRPAKVLLQQEEQGLDLSLIKQVAYYVDMSNKYNLLTYLLQENQVDSAIIFVRTRKDVEQLAQALKKDGYAVLAIHGEQWQEDRHLAFRQFKTEKGHLMVATDLLARGIDAEGLPYVFNYNVPNEPQTYVHRIGRTGRAGRQGVAISLCSNAELRFLKPIKKLVGKGKIEIVEQHPFSYAPREKK